MAPPRLTTFAGASRGGRCGANGSRWGIWPNCRVGPSRPANARIPRLGAEPDQEVGGMAEETDRWGDDVTIGEPFVASTPPAGPLFVGPEEDPDRFELLDDGTRGGE